MAFRFIISSPAGANAQEPKITDWYDEPTSMTAPTLIGQLRSLFPDMAISTERGNVVEAKSPDQAIGAFKKLKESKGKTE